MARPVKFKTVAAMQRIVDLYFKAVRYNSILFSTVKDSYEVAEKLIADLDTDDQDVVRGIGDSNPTVAGLALELDLSRQGLIEYGHKDQEDSHGDKFSDTVKRAKLRIEAALEQRLYSGAPVGAIFNLKNNFRYKDQTESTVTNRVTLERVVKRLDGTVDKDED